MPLNITIRSTTVDDLVTITDVHTLGFGYEKEARLTAALLADATATPTVSLLALHDGAPVGHILFTRVRLNGRDDPLLHILAPLAVTPEYQRKGVGGALIRNGIEKLRSMGSKLVFVLGHKEYYPRHGFTLHALRHGYQPPYPIPEENSAYWMFQPLTPEAVNIETGILQCADALHHPAHWRDDGGAEI
ncbi:GNAT family N-acetyltransferase [Desulfovibrio cuneatus]|uniref:GNAT family N-acetyltransferase n=1 Tax=Desulfovibrio cuneatus TaxID=159728 RepID=UPI000550BAC7|nr:N-acetyltransferase [Desulfovibrio cuneatus]